ncbi:MAG TPA: DUF6036 family nucleotidyltransferase [Bdellovibrionota bacterium]|nr:DUF6036 family nucleotidyltransferase [Bdellovibrionota bacterium]
MAAPKKLEQALLDLTKALEELRPPGVVIGGIAVIASGFARLTRDLDATFWLNGDVEEAIDHFKRHRIVPRIKHAAEFARTKNVLLMQHKTTHFPIDLSIAMLPFEQGVIAHPRKITYKGFSLRIPHLTDLLVYKLVAHRPQDLQDAEELLNLSRQDVDVRRASKTLREFARILERPELIDAWKKMLKSFR